MSKIAWSWINMSIITWLWINMSMIGMVMNKHEHDNMVMNKHEHDNMVRSQLQFDVTFTGFQFRFVFDTSSTPSRATAWLAMHRSTWSSSATPWMTFQQGATFGRRPRLSSWSLDIGRNDPVEEVSPSPHHSCGIYFLPTSDFSTMNINFSGRDLKLTICNSPYCATEDRCHMQCDLYYYYYYYYYYGHDKHEHDNNHGHE